MPGLLPAVPPRPATLSLVNSANTPDLTGDDSRWPLGFKTAPEGCGDAWVEDPCNVGARTVTGRPEWVENQPMNVVAADRCSAFGFAAEDYEGRARRLLARCQSKQIAAELWTGALAAAAGWPNQFFTDLSSDVLTDGAATPTAALACLEQALAQCGCGDRGMIHATPQLATHWATLGTVLRREGSLLLTVHDTVVVPDAGYDGSGPGGVAAAATQWAYATGMVTVRLGPVSITPGEFADALDRSDNKVTFFAERPAAATWDGCCHAAVEVALPVCLVGGVS